MKVGDIGVGATFYAPDAATKVKKVWIVQRRDGKQVRATRRDGRFAFFAPETEVEPGPRPHGRRNK
jgi:hypothetical protein